MSVHVGNESVHSGLLEDSYWVIQRLLDGIRTKSVNHDDVAMALDVMVRINNAIGRR